CLWVPVLIAQRRGRNADLERPAALVDSRRRIPEEVPCRIFAGRIVKHRVVLNIPGGGDEEGCGASTVPAVQKDAAVVVVTVADVVAVGEWRLDRRGVGILEFKGRVKESIVVGQIADVLHL